MDRPVMTEQCFQRLQKLQNLQQREYLRTRPLLQSAPSVSERVFDEQLDSEPASFSGDNTGPSQAEVLHEPCMPDLVEGGPMEEDAGACQVRNRAILGESVQESCLTSTAAHAHRNEEPHTIDGGRYGRVGGT